MASESNLNTSKTLRTVTIKKQYSVIVSGPRTRAWSVSSASAKPAKDKSTDVCVESLDSLLALTRFLKNQLIRADPNIETVFRIQHSLNDRTHEEVRQMELLSKRYLHFDLKVEFENFLSILPRMPLGSTLDNETALVILKEAYRGFSPVDKALQLDRLLTQTNTNESALVLALASLEASKIEEVMRAYLELPSNKHSAVNLQAALKRKFDDQSSLKRMMLMLAGVNPALDAEQIHKNPKSTLVLFDLMPPNYRNRVRKAFEQKYGTKLIQFVPVELIHDVGNAIFGEEVMSAAAKLYSAMAEFPRGLIFNNDKILDTLNSIVPDVLPEMEQAFNDLYVFPPYSDLRDELSHRLSTSAYAQVLQVLDAYKVESVNKAA